MSSLRVSRIEHVSVAMAMMIVPEEANDTHMGFNRFHIFVHQILTHEKCSIMVVR